MLDKMVLLEPTGELVGPALVDWSLIPQDYHSKKKIPQDLSSCWTEMVVLKPMANELPTDQLLINPLSFIYQKKRKNLKRI